MTVYFMKQEGVEDGMIKIGYSEDPEKRYTSIKTSCPTPLSVVATIDGGKETERFIHSQLEDSRHHGEWFRPTPKVLALIEDVQRSGVSISPNASKRAVSTPHDSAREDLRIATDLLAVAMGPMAGKTTKIVALDRLHKKLKAINPAWTLRKLKSIQGQETTSINLWVIRDLLEVIDNERGVSRRMGRTGTER